MLGLQEEYRRRVARVSPIDISPRIQLGRDPMMGSGLGTRGGVTRPLMSVS